MGTETLSRYITLDSLLDSIGTVTINRHYVFHITIYSFRSTLPVAKASSNSIDSGENGLAQAHKWLQTPCFTQNWTGQRWDPDPTIYPARKPKSLHIRQLNAHALLLTLLKYSSGAAIPIDKNNMAFPRHDEPLKRDPSGPSALYWIVNCLGCLYLPMSGCSNHL